MTASSTGRWSFLIPTLVFAACCYAVMWGILFLLKIPFSDLLGGAVIYFTVLTLVLHAWIESAVGPDSKAMVHRFMASLAIKMMVSLLLLVVLLIKLPRDTVITFALVFVGCYLAFLAFSTSRSLRLLKRIGKP
jgi:F0F1-type ATP synthase assembly protein I